MSAPERDLSPVLPKKLRPLFYRQLLNYFIFGLLGANVLGSAFGLLPQSDDVSLDLVPNLPYLLTLGILLFGGLFFLKDKKHKIHAIMGNALLLPLCLCMTLIEMDSLCPFLAQSKGIMEQASLYCGLASAWGMALLLISSRRSILAMGPRQHAAKRLNLAEASMGIAALIPFTWMYFAPSCYPTLCVSLVILLLCVMNIISYIKLPCFDLSPWQEISGEKQRLNTLNSCLLYFLALPAFFLVIEFAFPLGISPLEISPLGLSCILAGCWFVGKIVAGMALSKSKDSLISLLGWLGIITSAALIFCYFQLIPLSPSLFAGALSFIALSLGCLSSVHLAKLHLYTKDQNLLIRIFFDFGLVIFILV